MARSRPQAFVQETFFEFGGNRPARVLRPLLGALVAPLLVIGDGFQDDE